jgi:hypothetical protein
VFLSEAKFNALERLKEVYLLSNVDLNMSDINEKIKKKTV